MTIRFLIGIILVVFFGIDLAISFCKGISNLPTSFTEWTCFPFYFSIFHPFVKKGFGMFKSIILRLIEFIGIVVGTIFIVLNIYCP